MNGRQKALVNASAGALIAGEAAYWFIGGGYANHAMARNLLVVMQFFAGVAIWAWSARKAQSTATDSGR